MSPPKHSETSDAATKLARARERNLEAQARYRRKNADAIQELEAALAAKQKVVSDAQDKRVHAYRHNHTLHSRISRAIEVLTTLAQDTRQRAEDTPPPQRPQQCSGSSGWNLKSCLRRSIARRYTPRAYTSRSSDPASPASSTSSVDAIQVSGDPIPAPLSASNLLQGATLCGGHAKRLHEHTPVAIVPGGAQQALQPQHACTTCAVPSAEATVQRFAAQMLTLQQAVATAEGAPEAPVRWFLQSPWNVATGVPVSFTPSMASEASLASAYFCAVLLAMENLFLAISLNPAEALPQLPGTPLNTHGGAAAAAELSDRLQEEVDALRASVPSASGATQEAVTARMACGVDGTYPISRGVPHALVALCCGYRKRLPRWQWLQALAAFLAVSGGMLKGITAAGDSCRHRQDDGTETGVHVLGRCPRCSVAATLAACIGQCIARERTEVIAMQPQAMGVLHDRLEEVTSFSAVMLSQTLLEEPSLSRMFYHNELSQKHIEQTVLRKEDLVLALYGRLKLTPHQLHLAADIWQYWCRRRRMHDAIFNDVLCHLGHIGDICTASRQLLLEDYVAANSEWGGFGMTDWLEPPLPAPAGTSPGGLGPVFDALERLRAVHAADGDMMAEFVRVVRMPGAVFLPEQLTLAVSLTTACSITAVDWLWVCRCAAQDAARRATFSGLA